MTRWSLRKRLLAGSAIVALPGATALALASPASDPGAVLPASSTATAVAASSGGSANARCTPSKLNTSAVLPGTDLAVSPLPGSYDASPDTQISLLGAPAADIEDVTVTGSQTGSHPGRLLGYSQGDGASFVPSRALRSGETVTVRGQEKIGSAAQPFAYSFVVAYPDTGLATSSTKKVTHDLNELQHFHTRPELEAPVLDVTANSSQTAPGDIFASPYSGPGPSGPEIFESSGRLVWFDPLPAGTEATNLQVQRLNGQPVLTFWEGEIPPQGFGRGEDIIENSSYERIETVHAGNGQRADLHEFRLTEAGTALLTAFDPLHCNLSSVGGTHNDAVTAATFQEVDLKTGLVRREWDSLDHVPISDSYSPIKEAQIPWPYDYLHINTIDPTPGGTTLLSGRNTSTLYEIDTRTGQVLGEIGGKHSTIKLGSGAATAYQHDATVQPNGTITVFDNGGVPKVHPQSRGLVLSLNAQAKTDEVLAEYENPTPPLASGSQGSMQVLIDGNVFIGWGSEPYFTEFTAAGALLYGAHWHGSYNSYRGFRFEWTGAPKTTPSVAASASSPTAPVTVYASWNGDTRTASWRVLGGRTKTTLSPVASAAKSGFETAITTPAAETYVAVQALSATGAVLSTSKTIRA